jgi:uncharacterized protein (UPF0333 family)
MEKGQVALEFIFLILIVVVYIFTTTKPIIENSQGALEDVENVAKTNREVTKIVSSINKMTFLGSGSKETLVLDIPINSTIICDTNIIGFISQINLTGTNPAIGVCSENICDKNYMINSIESNCNFNNLIGKTKVIIQRSENSVNLIQGS